MSLEHIRYHPLIFHTFYLDFRTSLKPFNFVVLEYSNDPRLIFQITNTSIIPYFILRELPVFIKQLLTYTFQICSAEVTEKVPIKVGRRTRVEARGVESRQCKRKSGVSHLSSRSLRSLTTYVLVYMWCFKTHSSLTKELQSRQAT